jgi:hypothetical protein
MRLVSGWLARSIDVQKLRVVLRSNNKVYGSSKGAVKPSSKCNKARPNSFEPNKKIRIGKTEYPQKNQCHYIYALQGISAKDFIRGTKTGLPLEHIQLTHSEIEEVLSILENEGLISRIKSRGSGTVR